MGEVAATLGIVAGVLISLGIIWAKGVKPVARFVKRIHAMFETLLVIEERSAQLIPNSGTHMRDSITRIEESLGALSDRVDGEFRAGRNRFAAMDQEHVRLWRTIAAREVADAAGAMVNPESTGNRDGGGG